MAYSTIMYTVAALNELNKELNRFTSELYDENHKMMMEGEFAGKSWKDEKYSEFISYLADLSEDISNSEKRLESSSNKLEEFIAALLSSS